MDTETATLQAWKKDATSRGIGVVLNAPSSYRFIRVDIFIKIA